MTLLYFGSFPLSVFEVDGDPAVICWEKIDNETAASVAKKSFPQLRDDMAKTLSQHFNMSIKPRYIKDIVVGSEDGVLLGTYKGPKFKPGDMFPENGEVEWRLIHSKDLDE